ncbi:MAG: beta-ketoacyl synthase chain length factor [Burkholderiaceae bacterium]
MSGLTVWVDGVGVLGPGLPSWSSSLATLRGDQPHVFVPSVLPPPARLPPAERRRAGAAVKLAMAVADEAVAHAGADPHTLATVFSASSGEGGNCHILCETLATDTPMVSPTRFTNSVHNAAAGYWHIAVASRAASTSLGAFDASFGAGLIEAATSVALSGAPILLVASDTPYPEPLHAARPLPDNFGIALVLSATRSERSLASLSIELVPGASTPTACTDASLEALRVAIPAACGLPLLQALARGEEQQQTLALTYLPTLTLKVSLQRVNLHALA